MVRCAPVQFGGLITRQPPYCKEGQRLNTSHLVAANGHHNFQPGGESFEMSCEERGECVPVIWSMEVCLAECVDEYDASVLGDLAALLENGERLENALKKGSMGVRVALR